MTKDQIVKAVCLRLGNLRRQDDLVSGEVDMTIARLENEALEPWFLLSENNRYVLKAGQNRVPLPQGFLKEYEQGALYVNDGEKEIQLIKKSDDMLRKGKETHGIPTHYSLTNQYFRVYPTPREDTELELIFFRRSANLGEPNPWFVEASELVINETCFSICTAKKDQRSQMYKQMAQNDRLNISQRDVDRNTANYELILGGDD